MTRRLIKQIIIASVFSSILLLSGFLIYLFVKPEPTCFDGALNQNEEEIDCGGPCISCELAKIEDVEVLWVKVIPTQADFYDIASQIKNPNPNYGSGRIPYQFKLYNSQDNLIGEHAGQTFILPNQTKYLVQAKIENKELIQKAELSFGEIEWQKPEMEFQLSQLAIQRKEYRLLEDRTKGFSQAKALLINKTNFDFEKVSVDVLLFDPFHNLLAISTTEVRVLSSGQERDFVATWFEQFKGQVSLIEIEAETNVFDPANYISVDQTETEPFQEY